MTKDQFESLMTTLNKINFALVKLENTIQANSAWQAMKTEEHVKEITEELGEIRLAVVMN